MSTIEACSRIFQFDINDGEHVVQRLNFHLENEQPNMFDDSNYLNNVLNELNIRKTIFME